MEIKEVTISARIEESLRDDLQRLAAENERSFSGEIRRALRLYVMGAQMKEEA